MNSKAGVLLSIAGYDPSASAGVLADVNVFACFGFKPIAVPTCITVQDQYGIDLVQPLDQKLLYTSIKRMLSSFDVAGIKIGLVPNKRSAEAIARALKDFNKPVVLDPVLVSTAGGVLTDSDATEWMRQLLLPVATVITPNRTEFEKLFGSRLELENFTNLTKLKAVLLTGVSDSNSVYDLLIDRNGSQKIACATKVNLRREVHGTGCHHSSALLAMLAKGLSVKDAACKAQKFLSRILTSATANFGGKVDLIMPLQRRLDDES